MTKANLLPVTLVTLLCALLPVAPAAASEASAASAASEASAASAASAADLTPPVTTCDAPSGWQRAPFTVHFTASDAESGVAATWAALDDGPLLEVGGPAGASVDIPAPADHSFDGVHTLSYYSTDAAGNSEVTHTIEVKIDTTGPTTSVRAAVGYMGRAITLRYSVADRLSPDVVAVTLLVTDGVGQTVKSFALGSKRTGTWYRVRWTPAAAGVFHYAVSAQDLAGNGEVSAGSAGIVVEWLARETIGRSYQGRPITVTQLGGGSRRLLVVGGVHGNESGTAVATQFVTYLLAHPGALPSGARIDVIGCANPDGYARRIRGNARSVDLNRNLPTANWRRRLDRRRRPRVRARDQGAAGLPAPRLLRRREPPLAGRHPRLHRPGGTRPRAAHVGALRLSREQALVRPVHHRLAGTLRARAVPRPNRHRRAAERRPRFGDARRAAGGGPVKLSVCAPGEKPGAQ